MCFQCKPLIICACYLYQVPGTNHLLADPGLQQSRGFFGCAQPTPIIAVDEPSKGLRIQGRSVKRRNLSDDFWSSSPRNMENSALQSRHSMSSISTTAQPNDQHAAGSSSNPNEFVNQGKRSFMSALAPVLFTAYRFRIFDCLFHTAMNFQTTYFKQIFVRKMSIYAYLDCISAWFVCAPENLATA